MDLIKYIGVKVKVQTLLNSYYYVGTVKDSTTNECLELIDIKGNNVSLTPQAILSIVEVSNGY